MDRQKKIQYLLVTHLLEKGHIELTLPDGMVLEMGIVQENELGELEKADDYCWIIASQKDRIVSMDSFNFGLRYAEDSGKMIFEDSILDHDGQQMKVLQAI